MRNRDNYGGEITEDYLQSSNYFVEVEKLSREYNIPTNNIYGMVLYQDLKRTKKGKARDLEKAVKVIGRYLRKLKNENRNKNHRR